MSSTSGSQAFREMSLASSRELLRSAKTFFGLTAIFVFFLGLVTALYLVDNLGHPDPVVVVSSADAGSDVTRALHDADIQVAKTAGDANAVVSVSGTSATVRLDRGDTPRWGKIVRALERSGLDPDRITVRDEFGSVQRDILRSNLSTVIVSGLVAIAFAGTTVPLVAMRRRGTLRLLGTTPVPRLQFLIAQTPVRVVLGVVEALVVLGIALGQGYVATGGLWRLPITFLLGFAMLFAFAFLLAGRSSNPDLMLQIVGIVPVVVLFGSGTLLPLNALPTFVTWISNALPSTWFMQAITADVTGSSPFVPVGVLWVMMAAVTAVLLAVSSRVFRWDQGDL
jgi:ABC-2 type transport system permease protein